MQSLKSVLALALAASLCGCGQHYGCGLGTHPTELAADIYYGPSGPIDRIQRGDALECRVKIPF